MDASLGYGYLELGMHILVTPFVVKTLASRIKDAHL